MKPADLFKVIHVDEYSATPKYLQLSDSIISAIENGHLQKDDVLPSINELSYMLEISRDTAEKGYKYLKKLGVIVSVSGRGYYVDNADFKKKVKEAQNVHDIKCFFLGANQDAVMTGQQYGFNARQSLTFGSDAVCAASALRSVTQVMREASQGSNDIGFTQTMRQSSAPASAPTISTSFNLRNNYHYMQNLRHSTFTPPLPIANIRQTAAQPF